MTQGKYEPDRQTLISLFFEFIHLMVIGYGLWFSETERQLGLDKAIEADDIAWKRLVPILLGRFARRYNLTTMDGIPEFLAGASKEELSGLLLDMEKNWSAGDGVWFQTIERNFDYEMYNAKRINDTCLGRYSYIEAKRIMRVLNLPEGGGIAVLKEALKYRHNSMINRYEIIDTGENKIIYRMSDCRVQTSRRRANLPDYPCKSAGVVEQMRFAEGVDPRIKTTCIGCPPDLHPTEWWCAWEYEL